jgi:hypothetical protein
MPRLPADPFVINWRDPECGFWMLYIKRGSFLVPARIWLCDHEPGEPDNKRDRWPHEHLAAEIAGRWVETYDVWWRVLLRETRPGHWKCAQTLRPEDGLTERQEYEYRMAVLQYEKSERNARPDRPVDLKRLQLPF